MEKNVLKRFVQSIIRAYQGGISAYTQPHCIYVPTCSAYALEAVERYGVVRGGLLAAWRLLRCNPFAHGGYDPVPDQFTFQRQFHVWPRPRKRTHP
ncbi:MAG: membrane protein insertion efficiency factor YidD [Oscillospiraceae bacterium]